MPICLLASPTAPESWIPRSRASRGAIRAGRTLEAKQKLIRRHFRGNLDNWDPALIDALAPARRVITFDNAGVGGSAGTTPDTVEQMARDAIAFIAALELSQVDLLGFSIGSFIAQQLALTRPGVVRRLVLASAAPQGAAGMHGWTPLSSVLSALPRPAPRNISASSSPDPPHTGRPVFVANGDSDPMIRPHYTYCP
jgi:pimeloyl-ACP methyl ester carboxylesterase